MKMKDIISGVGLLAFCLSCASSSIRVEDYYFKKTDFSNYRTFDWQADSEAAGVLQQFPELQELIKNAVNSELQAKGLELQRGDPDLKILYFIIVKDRTLDVSIAQGRAYGSSGSVGVSFSDKVLEQKYQEGTLVLDFLETKTGDRLWRGSATKTIEEQSTPEKRKETINTAVQKIFEKFPKN